MSASAGTLVLAATLHDPQGALAGDVRRFLPRLAKLYDAVWVATSPPTAAAVRQELERGGAHAGTPRRNARGPLYRRCLRTALEQRPAHVHYLDFDRALHWLRSAPAELPRVLRLARRHDLLLIGRTERAHRSHQRPLHATEAVVNRLLAMRLGLEGRVDFLVPSFVATGELARNLLARSRAESATLYGEWAALLAGLGPPLAYLECRGLDWETPDRAARAVRRIGLAAWRDRFDTAAEWAARRALAGEIVAGFARTIRRHPPRAALHRLALRPA